MLPRLLGVLALGLAFSQACSAAEDLPRYQLDVELTPATHLLAVEASVVLPESLAGKSVEFLLAEPLTIESATPAVTRLPLEGAAGFEGINGSSASQGGNSHAARYRVQLPAGQRTLKLRYRGPVAFPLEAPVQEYARGFTETMGTIGPEG
ncbi:MAG: hypothetical protein H7A17_08195, partial [Sinobacteraceae bacterium]|nr:hypothetical protein [Nevskiaceae bacterium]